MIKSSKGKIQDKNIIDSNIYAKIADNETITGVYTFNSTTKIVGNVSIGSAFASPDAIWVGGDSKLTKNVIIGPATTKTTGTGLYLASQTGGVLELNSGQNVATDVGFPDLILSHSQSGTGHLIGRIIGVNRNVATADKRLGQISFVTDGRIDSGAITFNTLSASAFAERMRITSGGAVAIGSAFTPDNALFVNGAVKTNNNMTITSDARAGGTFNVEAANGSDWFTVGAAAGQVAFNTNGGVTLAGGIDLGCRFNIAPVSDAIPTLGIRGFAAGVKDLVRVSSPSVTTGDLFIINASGNVSIGSAFAPANKLWVGGTTTLSGNLTVPARILIGAITGGQGAFNIHCGSTDGNNVISLIETNNFLTYALQTNFSGAGNTGNYISWVDSNANKLLSMRSDGVTVVGSGYAGTAGYTFHVVSTSASAANLANVLYINGSSSQLNVTMGTAFTGSDRLFVSGNINSDANIYSSGASGEIYNAGAKMTFEGGHAVKLINRTGAASVKGTMVCAGTGQDFSFNVTPAGDEMAVGAVYEAGVADGSACWVVTNGIADVLLEDGTSSTRHNWCEIGAVAGRANCTQNSPNPVTHFDEIGHCIQSVASGTNVLARILMHFN